MQFTDITRQILTSHATAIWVNARLTQHRVATKQTIAIPCDGALGCNRQRTPRYNCLNLATKYVQQNCNPLPICRAYERGHHVGKRTRDQPHLVAHSKCTLRHSNQSILTHRLLQRLDEAVGNWRRLIMRTKQMAYAEGAVYGPPMLQTWTEPHKQVAGKQRYLDLLDTPGMSSCLAQLRQPRLKPLSAQICIRPAFLVRVCIDNIPPGHLPESSRARVISSLRSGVMRSKAGAMIFDLSQFLHSSS